MKLLLIGLLSLSGCASYMKYKDCHDRSVAPASYSDINASMSYEVLYDQAASEFVIENKTDKMMKIIWDESSFIDQQGLSNAIFTGDMKIIDRGQSVPATTIQPKSKAKVMITPKNKIEWSSAGGWTYFPLCGSGPLAGLGSKIDTSMCENKPMSYRITYEIDGKKKTTTHDFKMTTKLKSSCEGYDLTTGKKTK